MLLTKGKPFYKIAFLQKCILALECSNMCVSGFTYNFVLQNQFLHRKFYAKNQKTKNAFLDPKKTFLYKTYEKNFVRLKKFAL